MLPDLISPDSVLKPEDRLQLVWDIINLSPLSKLETNIMESKQKWKFTQVFGDKFSADKVANEDVISALSFDKSGNFLAVGDRAGRLILFQRNLHTKSKTPFNEFIYLTEIQSHFKEFDCLQSVDIDEKINCIEWINQPNENMMILTTNDKTIKLWKVSNKIVKKSEKTNKPPLSVQNLKMPKLKTIEQAYCPSLKRTFPNLHGFHIHSLSLSQDNSSFISSDDLSVFAWDLEVLKHTFALVNIKPPSMNELTEVITTVTYSKNNDSMFAMGTSKGFIKIYDTRESSKMLTGGTVFEDENSKKNKNLFTDIISSIADVKFMQDQNQIISRDYLTTKVWDTRKSKEPLKCIKLYEPLNSKLYEVYEKDHIFDKFNIGLSGDDKSFTTGIYNNYFHIVDIATGKNTQFELNFNKKTISKAIPPNYFENLGPSFDFTKKVIKTAWNPVHNCIVLCSLNCLFIYNAI